MSIATSPIDLVAQGGGAVAKVYGEPMLELPHDLYIPPEALEVFLDTFEGPLDLLLYLIRRQNINVLEIPMAELTRQYLGYVEMMRRTQLELAAEYLLMAAVLIEIKSRLLLPKPPAAPGAEPEDPRAELVRRLLEYERMKKAAREIDALPHLALTMGGIGALDAAGRVVQHAEPVLVRMQRREILTDVFGVAWAAGDASGQDTVRASLRAIARAGAGALVYLRTEGSGDDLPGRLARIRRPGRDDINAPDLTRVDGMGSASQPMDARLFGVGGQILRDLGLSRLRLLTNHPKPMPGLHGFGLDIVEHVAIS